MTASLRRRDVLAFVGAAAAWPVRTRAQDPQVLGFLSSGAPEGYVDFLAAFREGLAAQGYAEVRNVIVETRWAGGGFAELPRLAEDLVRREVKLIATTGIGSALAAKTATATIPIVFLSGDDPVRFGLVASFNRPGGNATGINLLTSTLVAKRLDLVHALAPAGRVAFLINSSSPEAQSQLRDLEAAAQASMRPLAVVLTASNDADIERAFADAVTQRAGALLVSNDPFFSSRRDQLVGLAAKHALPAVYDRREYASAGGLISYGVDYRAAYREMGVYAGRILRGESPADLPVQQPTRFELVINLKSAKALGLDIPPTLLARADEVIE